ncbi:uncharacterized protein E0L32_000531 [Thyridium curvatum]|uniref:Uncharacterized protein n=1 Tax=Thyridium curvatum TaxID=1093900 RepID=A0A507B315_9PEZI|nr:uncharacterized protein E0L32_000531 [Thyridium curvatum]TPX14137.1 hypothetical protein E0L32_000531 [Thyridium curvatum]
MTSDEIPTPAKKKPDIKLVASTSSRDARADTDLPLNNDFAYLKSAQWSDPSPLSCLMCLLLTKLFRTADGTTLITSSSDLIISSYVLPEDLLAPKDEPLHLDPQGKLALPEPSNTIAPAPYFSLGTPYTQTVLVGSRDIPIQLYHALPDPTQPEGSAFPQPIVASYPLIKPQTEEYLAPLSMLWPAPGTHFLTGTANLISYFDITRTGEGPVLRIPTIPSTRHILKGGGVGMRGTVSALSAQTPDGNGGSLVAAGTWTRWVGLYDFAKAGECVATWGVERSVDETATDKSAPIGGTGIMQTIWSPCGRYLVVNERRSTGMLVYDVRVTGKMLGWLAGRDAESTQRLTCDVYPGSGDGGGFEVWAGTRDGTAKVWEGVGSREGAHEPSWDWKAYDSATGSTAMHPSGSVVATCSGSWTYLDEDDRPYKRIMGTSELNVWSIGLPEPDTPA